MRVQAGGFFFFLSMPRLFVSQIVGRQVSKILVTTKAGDQTAGYFLPLPSEPFNTTQSDDQPHTVTNPDNHTAKE
jgi:hypothetical protein